LAWVVVVLAGILLAWMFLPVLQGEGYFLALEQTSNLQGYFKQVLWHDRSVDVLLQAALIFAGVLTVLGLLTDDPFFAGKEHSHDL